jgi:hypothetical protein
VQEVARLLATEVSNMNIVLVPDNKCTGGMITGRGKSKFLKICLSATLAIINSTWTTVGLNPIIRGQEPVNNRLR